jgi:hypothetical protein
MYRKPYSKHDYQPRFHRSPYHQDRPRSQSPQAQPPRPETTPPKYDRTSDKIELLLSRVARFEEQLNSVIREGEAAARSIRKVDEEQTRP